MSSNPKTQYSDDQISALRFRCQTDLWFLCNDVLDAFNGHSFSETPHKAMCDFYVVKNPKYKLFRDFARDYKGPHDRIMLVPRQSRKSGIKIVDNCQWIITWPEIRIMTCTATNDLSTAFINQLSRYFTVKGKAERNPETNRLEGGDWSRFQLIFPEHCITEKEANQGEYITPVRYDKGNNFGVAVATAGTLSMDSTTSGWRCDVLDFDDPVSDRNSETGTLLEKLDNRIAMISELQMNNGFRHTVATRYHPDDPYGKQSEGHGIYDLYGDFEKDGLKYMCRPCWWLKGQPYKQPDYALGCPPESSLELFYPDGSPYDELRKKFKKPKVFFSQQLNDPLKSTTVSFSEDLIRSCFIDHSALPKNGSIFASWDLATTANKGSDHSAGIIGLLDDRREWWIIDIVLGRFNFSERVYQIVKTIQLHHTRRTCIENAAGAEDNYREPLDRQAKSMKIPLEIDWIPLGQGQKDAKYIRMSSVHPWMVERRIHFLNTLPCLDEVVRQYKNVGQKTADNEIPDATARLLEQYTRYAAEVKATTSAEDSYRWKDMEEREFHNMIFRTGKYTPIEPTIPEDPRTSPSFAIDELFK